MDSKKILNYIESYLLPVLFLFQALKALLVTSKVDSYSIFLALNDIVRPVTFAIVLFFSSRKVSKQFDAKILVGIILSYIPFFFFEFSPLVNDKFVGLAAFALNLFYLFLMFGALFQIRSNFTVLPGFKSLETRGLYSIVRHPIYSSYLHLSLIYLLINLTSLNALLVACVFSGINIRAQAEEKIIQHNDKNYVRVMPKFRYFQCLLTTPLILLVTYSFIIRQSNHNQLSVHLAYPIYSLKPHQADDWSSFFVMNHIYPRFNSRIGEFRSNSIFDRKEVICSDGKTPVFSPDCKTVKVLYEVKSNLEACNSKPYNDEDFENELSEIQRSKNWIFPNFQFCGKGCFEFSNVANIQDRFDSIYLRFGWSKSDLKDIQYGISPNCFHVMTSNGSTISEGQLKTSLLDVHLSQNEKNNYDVILYGNKPESSTYQSLDFYNPIYFYLLTTKPIKENYIQTIQNIFLQRKVISQKAQGLAVNSKPVIPRNVTKIKLPDYFEGCNDISKILNEGFTNLKFDCANISVFTEQTVKKGLSWDGFISPLTPGMPGKNGIQEQYFNPISKDNWLGPNPKKTNVILLGTLSGVIQVKRDKFCSIKPNSLGLSDITIDDFVECN